MKIKKKFLGLFSVLGLCTCFSLSTFNSVKSVNAGNSDVTPSELIDYLHYDDVETKVHLSYFDFMDFDSGSWGANFDTSYYFDAYVTLNYDLYYIDNNLSNCYVYLNTLFLEDYSVINVVMDEGNGYNNHDYYQEFVDIEEELVINKMYDFRTTNNFVLNNYCEYINDGVHDPYFYAFDNIILNTIDRNFSSEIDFEQSPDETIFGFSSSFDLNEEFGSIVQDLINISFNSGSSNYTLGYNAGYNAGNTQGINEGYANGYNDGYNDALGIDSTTSSIFNGILNVALVPINIFLAMFNFEILGINISAMVSSLLTVCIVIIIIRTITGKKND